MTVGDIFNAIEGIAPYETQEEWDNSGFMCGDPDALCTGVVLSLDVTATAIEKAKETDSNVIVSHHPMIFHKLGSVPSSSFTAKCLLAGISVISAHTNLDKAQGGVNDALAQALRLRDVTVAADGMCRMGRLPIPMSPEELAHHVKISLHADPVRFTEGAGDIVTVGICGGSGGDFWRDMRAVSCDAFISGDLRHDVFVDASNEGFTVIDAGHYRTEQPVMAALGRALREAFPTLPVFPCSDAAPYKTV